MEALINRTSFVFRFMFSQPMLLFWAALPAIIISLYMIWHDRKEREPVLLLITCFIFGTLSTFPAIWMERYGMDYFGLNNSFSIQAVALLAFVVVAFSEEFSKFLFLRGYIYPQKAFDEPLDGIVYSVMISMGFAAWENVLYVVVRGGGTNLALLRMFTAVPAHAAFAVIMGYYVGKAKFAESWQKIGLLLTGLFFAVIVHGLYDFFLFQHTYPILSVLTFVTLGIALIISYNFIRKAQWASREIENPPSA